MVGERLSLPRKCELGALWRTCKPLGSWYKQGAGTKERSPELKTVEVRTYAFHAEVISTNIVLLFRTLTCTYWRAFQHKQNMYRALDNDGCRNIVVRITGTYQHYGYEQDR